MNPKDRDDFLKRPTLDLGGRHKNRRIEIAHSWAATKDPAAGEPLATVASRQDDPEVRLAAVQALGALGGGQATTALAALLGSGAESALHGPAIVALGQIGDEPAVKALIGAWGQVEAAQRDAIGQALAKLGPARTVEPLIVALGHASPVVREEAAKTLRRSGGITPRLVAALGHADGRVREGASALLVQMGAPAVPELAAALGQADDRVRTGASEALVKLGAPAMEKLMPLLTGADVRAAQAAGDVLTKIGEPAVRPLLLAGTPQATDVLRRMGQSAIKPLVAALKDVATRSQATALLAELGEPAKEQLYAALDIDDEETRQAVVAVLTHITGESAEELAEVAHHEFMQMQIEEGLPIEHGEKWRPTLPLIRRATKLDPESAVDHYWLAKIYVELGQDELAVQHYERALTALHRDDMPDEFTVKTRQRLTGYYYEHKEYDKAIQHAESMLQVMADNAGGYARVGVLYCLAQQHERAVPYFEKALQLGADEVETSKQIAMAAFEAHSSILARAELDEDQLRRAVSFFKNALFYGERCLRSRPNDRALNFVPMLRQIANELGDVDRYELAFAYRLRGEVMLQNTLPLLMMMPDLGKSTLQEDVIPAFQEAIRLKPDYTAARGRLAEAARLLRGAG